MARALLFENTAYASHFGVVAAARKEFDEDLSHVDQRYL
jgi:hypothetical protein